MTESEIANVIRIVKEATLVPITFRQMIVSDLRTSLATESAPTEPEPHALAYASLLRVAQKYVAFCGQAGVKADASSLDPTEQLHAQALAAIQRAKVAALVADSAPCDWDRERNEIARLRSVIDRMTLDWQGAVCVLQGVEPAGPENHSMIVQAAREARAETDAARSKAVEAAISVVKEHRHDIGTGSTIVICESLRSLAAPSPTPVAADDALGRGEGDQS